ncbi:hypothetical protein [Sorangium sp. So ce363]|uniref:hypothetical protein n=1 Tax=Sorangium sp. So ce363 TaxID=3133304 RepID=UPI003F64184D
MSSTRTAWHALFAAPLVQRGPRRFEVRREVPLSTEPLRAAYLLQRADAGSTDPQVAPAWSGPSAVDPDQRRRRSFSRLPLILAKSGQTPMLARS